MDKYILNLTADERAALTEVYARKRVSALRRSRAGILLKADEGLTDAEIAEDLGVGTATVERIRKRAVLEGIAAALERKKQDTPSRKPRLDGRAEARLVQLACSQPPEGHARWTLTLLGDKLVELNVVESVSRTTIHRRLKKTASSRGR
jgi:transposase